MPPITLPLLLVLCISGLISSHQPEVTIPSLGRLRGSWMLSSSGRNFSAFRGVPYAEPPVGELRFRDPIAVKPWKGETFDASQEGPVCILYDNVIKMIRGSEDCLKLNIYTHDFTNETPLRPVMVWIHGGSWSENSGNGETGFFRPDYFLDRDVVLVTINYRLEAFGFLSTNDAEAPGNYGLLDQSLALKWVRDHIGNFGGNSNLVTIFGQSAGAGSVELHMLSPRSKGLFHRAIAQSGSALCAWAVRNREVFHYTKLLAKQLGCPIASSTKLLDCLRAKSAEEIIGVRKTILTLDMLPLTFTPRIDSERKDPFLPAHPQVLIQEKRFNSVPFMTGQTENECAFFVATLLARNGTNLKTFKQDPIKYMPYILGIETHPKGREIAKIVLDKYFDLQKPFDDQLAEMEQMTSDCWFLYGINNSVHLLSTVSDLPVYYYHYAHRSPYTLATLMGAPIDLGVGHMDEIFMMFPNQFYSALTVPDDIRVSKTLLDLWTTFASNGIPESESVPERWLPMTKGATRYLKIDHNYPLKTTSEPLSFHKRLSFWNNLFGVYKINPIRDEL